jgi:hypothetical protein
MLWVWEALEEVAFVWLVAFLSQSVGRASRLS